MKPEKIIETDAYRRLSNPQTEIEWLTIEERAVFFGELRAYGTEKGYKSGWASMKYKDRFGDWPPRHVQATPEMECSSETLLWIKATMQDFWRRRA
jgi:hypothetical protein